MAEFKDGDRVVARVKIGLIRDRHPLPKSLAIRTRDEEPATGLALVPAGTSGTVVEANDDDWIYVRFDGFEKYDSPGKDQPWQGVPLIGPAHAHMLKLIE